MTTKKTIKTRVTTYIPEQRVSKMKKVPVLDEVWFDEDCTIQANRLWGLGIKEDCEVGVVLGVVPPGVGVRKPTGECVYKRADDDWVRRTLGIDDPRIILVGDRGNLTLEDPDRVMVARLSDLFRYHWDHIDDELAEYRFE